MTKIHSLLDSLEIPSKRKEITPENVRWLLRNLHFENKGKEGYKPTILYLKALHWKGKV